MTYRTTYHGHPAVVTYAPEDGVVRTSAEGMMRDGISAEGQSVEELARAFRESVDVYIASCDADERVSELPSLTGPSA